MAAWGLVLLDLTPTLHQRLPNTEISGGAPFEPFPVRCIWLLNMSRYAADAGSTSIAGHVQ